MRRLLVLASAIVFVDTMFYATISPLLPEYADELGLSKTAAGLLSASYAAGTLVGSLPAGLLATRVGPRRTVLAGLALLAASSLTFGLAENIVLLDVARFCQGIAGAATWAGALVWLIAAGSPARRGELIGTALGAAVAGALVGPALGSLATVAGTELVFGSVVVLAAVLAFAALRTPDAAPEPPAPLPVIGRALISTPVLAAAWLVLVPATMFGAVATLVPLRLDELGAGGLAIGGAFLASAAIEAAGAPLLGRLSDRRGRLMPVRGGLLGLACVAALLPWPDSIVLVFLLVVALGAASGACFAPAMALLSDRAEATGLQQGFAFALVNLAWASGQVLGGAAGGGAADALGDAVPYLAIAALCALTLAWLARRDVEPDAARVSAG